MEGSLARAGNRMTLWAAPAGSSLPSQGSREARRGRNRHRSAPPSCRGPWGLGSPATARPLTLAASCRLTLLLAQRPAKPARTWDPSPLPPPPHPCCKPHSRGNPLTRKEEEEEPNRFALISRAHIPPRKGSSEINRPSRQRGAKAGWPQRKPTSARSRDPAQEGAQQPPVPPLHPGSQTSANGWGDPAWEQLF